MDVLILQNAKGLNTEVNHGGVWLCQARQVMVGCGPVSGTYWCGHVWLGKVIQGNVW